MSDERLDYDMSDVSVSDTTASWVDAQADTPTMGKDFSDSEDTLSNLSFDNELVVDSNGAAVGALESPPQLASPKEAGAAAANQVKKIPEIQINLPYPGQAQHSQQKGSFPNNLQLSQSYKSDDENTSSSSGIRVQVCVTTADICVDGAGSAAGQEFQLNLPPGVSYQAPTVDFPASPSQIKFTKGESFLPKEDAGLVSDDDAASFTSSCRAHLDLNLQNGGGSPGRGGVGLHLTRKDSYTDTEQDSFVTALNMSIPSFQITGADDSLTTNYGNHNGSATNYLNTSNYRIEPESLLTSDIESGAEQQELDDYMEDFYLPNSNESVMSRQRSFRVKVQKELDTAAAQSAIRELNKFEKLLTHDEEAEHEHDAYYEGDDEIDGEGQTSSTPKTRRRSSTPKLDTPDLMKRLEENSDKITFGRGSEQVKDRRRTNKFRQALNFDDVAVDEGQTTNGTEPESILDIDALCYTHAPNLMSQSPKRGSDSSQVSEFEHFQLKSSSTDEPQSLLITTANLDDLESGFYLQKTTIKKLAEVYDLTNFTNLYTLSGELKDILTAVEIEEIVQNRKHLENIIDPKVMAALSWSLAENSLPPPQPAPRASAPEAKVESSDCAKNESTESPPPPVISEDSKQTANRSGSKNSSISAGFHSQSPSVESLTSGSESSDEVIFDSRNNNNKNQNEPPPAFVRGAPETASLRRKLKIDDESITSDLPTKYIDEPIPNPALQKVNGTNSSFSSSAGHTRSYSNGTGSRSASTSENNTVWRSLESLDDLNIEDDVESGNESESAKPNLVLVRRDSKRFKDSKRVVQGLFVESKNGSCNGTLKRIKAPLHLSEDYTPGTAASPPPETSILELSTAEGKHLNASKKRITVDEKILSLASELDDSSQATNADLTQSDVFHSIMSSMTSLKDEDPTIKSDGEFGDDDDEVDDITLDDTTPDDEMENSILGNIEDIEIIPNPNRGAGTHDHSQEETMWRSFRIGANDVQIDMKAIEPYRRVLSHGGYFDVEKNISIILFSGCYLPDRSRKEYSYLMDHLFLYVLSGLEELIAQDYILVYLHGATPRSCQPSFLWLKRCYQLIDRKLKKNLKSLYLVHPTFWLRTVVALTKPFISSKFSQKIQFVNTLSELCLEIPTEHLSIPEKVLQYDFDQRIAQLKKEDQLA